MIASTIIPSVKTNVEAQRMPGALGRSFAAILGERVASPIIQFKREGRQRSELMPGVEILANQINTILRGRIYRYSPDWLAFLSAAAVAAAVIIIAALTRGNYEGVRKFATLR
jgi:CHASE2 domain-containing sensor protein